MKIKNLCYPIPTIGRIAIGEKIPNADGQSLPAKLDHFVITSQRKSGGVWAEDPIAARLREKLPQPPSGEKKLREIPVRFLCNDPDLNLRARYETFDGCGRTLCAGDGENATRRDAKGVMTKVTCPGAEYCEYGRATRCKLMARLNVQIDEGGGNEQFGFLHGAGTYILRTAGYNTTRTLQTKIRAFKALLGGRLVGVPFVLKLRAKSSAGSRQSTFYYVDLELRVPVAEAAALAKRTAEVLAASGADVEAFEAALREGLANGAFEDSQEDAAEAAEYAEFGSMSPNSDTASTSTVQQDGLAPQETPDAHSIDTASQVSAAFDAHEDSSALARDALNRLLERMALEARV